MWRELIERIRQGHRTVRYPGPGFVLPDRYRGRPAVDASRCRRGCGDCAAACPTSAITETPAGPRFDLGRCLFCTDCTAACPAGALRFGPEHRLAASTRAGLVVDGSGEPLVAAPLEEARRRLFHRSLKLRQVSAGGCNACEADTNVLGTLAFDLGSYGIQFVASPRHADGILVTGPVSRNMELALLKTYEAVPAPKVVIAVGSCAISGGPFRDHPEVRNGVASLLPVDLFVPGCPPHPLTILDGLLRLLGRLPGELQPVRAANPAEAERRRAENHPAAAAARVRGAEG